MMEHVVNANYRGQMKGPLNLQTIQLPNSKLHQKPQQLVVKDSQGTVIFFNSGKFRVMGGVDELEATFLALKYTLQIDDEHFPEIQSQSYTSRVKLGYQVNLKKLVDQHQQQILYEPELFCAVRMMKYKPLSVNVFSTGAVVVCGIREPDNIYDIASDINDLCQLYKQT